MRHRLALTISLAVAGAVALVSLGVWQLQRHQWKQAVIAEMDGRLSAPPVTLPAAPDPDTHLYLPVRIEGRIGAEEIRVQASRKLMGAGYRIIAPFETKDGRRILIDRGFIPQTRAEIAPRPGGPATIVGNLHWPDEVDMFTPAPDRDAGLWFARDVPALAAALGTEATFVVVRDTTRPAEALDPLPLDTGGIPDNHLGYAIQWFLMAAVWVVMAGAFVRGQWRRAGKEAA